MPGPLWPVLCVLSLVPYALCPVPGADNTACVALLLTVLLEQLLAALKWTSCNEQSVEQHAQRACVKVGEGFGDG